MSISMEQLDGAVFLAFPEMKEMLMRELQERFSASFQNRADYGDLVVLPEYDVQTGQGGHEIPYWCRCALLEPVKICFESIGEAAAALQSLQRLWASYSCTCFRRTVLIQEKLPYISSKPRNFPARIPSSPVGLFALLDKNTMIASARTSSPFPAGRIQFAEDHENPPSRAYLKLQEALSLADCFFGSGFPSSGSRCLDAGACPGGWTYTLAQLGASVLAVDRTELAHSLMNHPQVEFMKHDAFTLKPHELGEFDWVFSDVICYPERLLGWIRMWLESGLTKRMVCTVKLQGGTDWKLISEFERIPHSKVVHLNYNKHELTFIHCG